MLKKFLILTSLVACACVGATESPEPINPVNQEEQLSCCGKKKPRTTSADDAAFACCGGCKKRKHV